MLLDLTSLQNRRINELKYNDTIILDESIYKDSDIRRLSSLDVKIEIHRATDSSYNMDLEIIGTMVLPCSVTLKDVDYPFDIKTEIVLSNEDDDESIKISQNSIDIIPIIWQNILLEIPLKVVSEDISDLTMSGDGWKLIREE